MKQLLKKDDLIDSKYRIQFFISGNSFFEKYRVKGENNNIYMLKMYNSAKLNNDDFTDDNLLEAEILKSIGSTGITKLVDSGELVNDINKYNYLVFEFISGENLLEKVARQGPLSEYSAIPIIIDLLETLKVLHKSSNPIIHNNINLKSIYIDYSNEEKPVLCEFGFARYFTSKRNSLNIRRLSPFYIAPELYNGIFTPQSDIFSVGALLYNLIMGIPPWFIELPQDQSNYENYISDINKNRKNELHFGVDELSDEHIVNHCCPVKK